VAARRRPADRGADKIHPAQRAARRHRHQCRGHALFLLPPHRKGEPQEVYTHPIGIGKIGWSTPEGVTQVVAHVKDPVWRPSAALRKDHREDNGEDLPAVVPAGPIIRWGNMNSDSAGRAI